MKKQPILYFLGNGLIVFSILLFLYIYYPLVSVYLLPQRIEQNIKEGIFITIPKIHAQSQVVLNVDPWNKDEYTQQLKKGVAHAKNTAVPANSGTSYLFAHSSDSPWNITRNNTAFFRLSELTIDDEIIISRNGKEFIYKVFERKEVWPTDTSYLQKNEKDQIILQTCIPIGTDYKRLLIFARP